MIIALSEQVKKGETLTIKGDLGILLITFLKGIKPKVELTVELIEYPNDPKVYSKLQKLIKRLFKL